MSVIEDGTGTGLATKVGVANRLHTHAFTICIRRSTALCGDAFIISSGNLTLTSANESAILYLKNNEDEDLIIISHTIRLGTSTGGSCCFAVIKMHLNSTGGTIISTATCSILCNRRIGDSTALCIDAFKGTEGATLTGGVTNDIISKTLTMGDPYVVPKGTTFGISVTPPTGNTSMVVQTQWFIIKDGKKHGID